jgi:hypothetical protein
MSAAALHQILVPWLWAIAMTVAVIGGGTALAWRLGRRAKARGD